jgi:hypothetical protein
MKDPTSDDIESLVSSWSWRLTKPLYRIEKEIRRWHRQRPADLLTPPIPPRGISASRGTAVENEALGGAPDRFVLYRILGNDLPPRHGKGQTRTNLALILAHEANFDDCEKRWIVNRIFDPEEEARIIDLLERSGQTYTRIPFDLEAYGRIGWDWESFAEPGFFLRESFEKLDPAARGRAEMQARRFKNLYAMNNNGGRNAALKEGRTVAKWILPWDGNCFVTESGWRSIRAAVRSESHFRYFVVPMLRVVHNDELLHGEPVAKPQDEPQLIFRYDSGAVFDEAFAYGSKPKVEMLLRLGVPGPWQGWETDPWELPSPLPSTELGPFGYAGWVGRLGSGHPELERGGNSGGLRSAARSEAILTVLDELDRRALAARHQPSALALYDEDRIAGLVADPSNSLGQELAREADAALVRGPYSVVHKVDPAPSGNRHDYLSAARYFWPNPATADGIPYVNRDGDSVLESGLPGFSAEHIDRLRLEHLFDNTTVLALAGTVHQDQRYVEHAARLVRTWFVDPETRMTPHLRFAQIARGHDRDENPGRGVLDFCGLQYFLDAVRLIERTGALDLDSCTAFRNWLLSYADWLRESPAGHWARRAPNNHGTFYDVQTAAIASFLGDAGMLVAVLRRARTRLSLQFEADGSQPLELSRTRPLHYCHYNLAGWTALARLAEGVGDDLWNFRTPEGRGLELAIRWLLDRPAPSDWPETKTYGFDVARIGVLQAIYQSKYGHAASGDAGEGQAIGGRPNSHGGIAPYWTLRL